MVLIHFICVRGSEIQRWMTFSCTWTHKKFLFAVCMLSSFHGCDLVNRRKSNSAEAQARRSTAPDCVSAVLSTNKPSKPPATGCCSEASDISVLCQWLSTLRRVCAHLPQLILHATVKQPIRVQHDPKFAASAATRRQHRSQLTSVIVVTLLTDRQSGFTSRNFYRRDTRFNTRAEKDPLGSVPGAWVEKKSHRKREV